MRDCLWAVEIAVRARWLPSCMAKLDYLLRGSWKYWGTERLLRAAIAVIAHWDWEVVESCHCCHCTLGLRGCWELPLLSLCIGTERLLRAAIAVIVHWDWDERLLRAAIAVIVHWDWDERLLRAAIAVIVHRWRKYIPTFMHALSKYWALVKFFSLIALNNNTVFKLKP